MPGPCGPQGQRGEQGVAGPPGPRNGGVVYMRWGKSSCPNITGTELVYAGRAGGSWYGHTGGGANYLCMPNDPDYLAYQRGVQGLSPVHGAEYEPYAGPLRAVHDHKIPFMSNTACEILHAYLHLYFILYAITMCSCPAARAERPGN